MSGFPEYAGSVNIRGRLPADSDPPIRTTMVQLGHGSAARRGRMSVPVRCGSYRARISRAVNSARAVLLGVAWAVPALMAVCGADAQVVWQESAAPRATERVVHRFDFDERDKGNLEDVPKFWEVFRPPGFPHYAGGSFDFDVGHEAPPSFHLRSEGRNAAFQYVGPDTRVRENSEYRIEGWIKADRLEFARACLSAFYVDRSGDVLLDTFVRSPYLGGDSDDWQRVSVHLSAAPSEALAVGVIVWVVQQSVWDRSVRPHHYIPRRDVLGGAWFDDLTVYRLPRVELASAVDGNVLRDASSRRLLVTLADHDDPSLVGTLLIRDAGGSLVESHAFPVVLDANAEPHRVSVEHLEPGLYRAELNVDAQGEALLTRTLDFVCLAPRLGSKDRIARSFGIALDPYMRGDPLIEEQMLLAQGAQTVSVPVWTGRPEPLPNAAGRRKLDRMFQTLVRHNYSLVAVLHGAPGPILQSAGAYAPSLVDLLSTGSEVWEPHLSLVAAPYAGLFRWWQIGADGDGGILFAERRDDVFDNVRSALRTYITSPVLGAPAYAGVAAPQGIKGVERITVSMDAPVPESSFAQLLGDWRGAGFEAVSARVDAHDAEVFDRVGRLAQWARRMILARHAGARTVFTAQTWRVRETPGGMVTEPDERFVLLRTMADLIGDASPGPALALPSGIRSVSFRDAAHSVVVFWNESGGAEPVRVPVQLGSARRQISLWGVESPLERDPSGRSIVTVTSMPVIVDGVENWLLDFMTSLSVKPAAIQSGDETIQLTFDWEYRGSRGIAGHVEFVVPDSWHILPSGRDFRLVPNRIERMEATVRLPPTEAAGLKTLSAVVRLSEPSYQIEIPLSLEVGLDGLRVWEAAYVDGNQLILRHSLTNNSDQTVDFRSAASVPGRERQYRPFTGLKPGDTQTALYRFENGRDLIGRRVSLVLREMNDGRRTHTLETEVP